MEQSYGCLLFSLFMFVWWLSLPPNSTSNLVCFLCHLALSTLATRNPAVVLFVFSFIFTVLAFTIFGLSKDVLSFGVIPLLLVWFICDQRRLWNAAIYTAKSPVVIVGAAVLIPTLTVYIETFIVWRLCLLVIYIFCLVSSFDGEHVVYMLDTSSELVKSMIWKVATIFTTEAVRMRYRGAWAYCSPYSRALVDKQLEHYYTLQSRTDQGSTSPHGLHETLSESYKFDAINIESCRIVCNYTKAGDDDYNSETASSCIASVSECDKTSETNIQRGYAFSLCTQFNKLEVSLVYEKETELESYTYFGVSNEAVVEVKRALEILEREGNIIFASLSIKARDTVLQQAHARCYEFEELFDLLVKKDFKLCKVKLDGTHLVHVSGIWQVFLFVMNLGTLACTAWINWSQVTPSKPSRNIAILLITFLCIFRMLHLLAKLYLEMQGDLRSAVYSVASRVCSTSDSVQNFYGRLQQYAPSLAFGNESRGFPQIFTKRKEICCLGKSGPDIRLPVIGTRLCRLTGVPREDTPGTYSLGNVDVIVERSEDDEGQRIPSAAQDLVQARVFGPRILVNSRQEIVHITMTRTRDRQILYNKYFRTHENNATDLVAVLCWLQNNHNIGVFKDWPRPGLAYIHTFQEIFERVLKEGEIPNIIYWDTYCDIWVQ